MILDLDKKNPLATAAVDTYGDSVSYGDIVGLAGKLSESFAPRSLIFILARNNREEWPGLWPR